MPFLLVALALLAPAATAATTPAEFRNAHPTTFGSVDVPPYLDIAAGEALDLAIPITFDAGVLRVPAARYLVGFDVHGDAARVSDVTLTRDGKPVEVERVDDDPRQPRLVIPGDALPREGDVELVLTGTVTTSADGQVHLGVIAIAFDASWGTLRARDASAAEAYGFTLLMSTGHAASGLEPRFTGQGNSLLALVPLLAVLAVAGWGLRAAALRLDPPRAPAPQPAPQPSPRPVARPATPFVAEPIRAPAPLPFPQTVVTRPAQQRQPMARGPRPTAVKRRKTPAPLAVTEAPVKARRPAAPRKR